MPNSSCPGDFLIFYNNNTIVICIDTLVTGSGPMAFMGGLLLHTYSTFSHINQSRRRICEKKLLIATAKTSLRH
jgi:hypothetical protein